MKASGTVCVVVLGALLGCAGAQPPVSEQPVPAALEPGDMAWWRDLPEAQRESSMGAGVALDAEGNIVVAGRRWVRTANPSSPARMQEHVGAFVAKLTPDGETLWEAELPFSWTSQANAVAVAPDGSIAVGGSFEGVAELGGDRVESEHPNGFVVRYSAEGQLISGTRHAAQESHVIDLAVAPSGTIHALGWFRGGEVTVGEDRVESDDDRFTPYWAVVEGSVEVGLVLPMPLVSRMALSPEGYPVFLAMGDASQIVPDQAQGEMDVLLLAFGDFPEERWVRVLGGESPDSAEDIAVDRDGNIVVLMTLNSAAYDSTSSDLRADPVRLAAREKDLVVVRCTAEGEPLNAFRVARPEDGWLGYEASVAVGPDGHVLVAGRFGETVRFEDGRRTAASSGDLFVSRFTADGEHLWTTSHQGNLPEHRWPRASGLDVVGAADRIVVTGQFIGWARVLGVAHESRAPEEPMFFLQSYEP